MTARTLMARAFETNQFSGDRRFRFVAGETANNPVGANEKKRRLAVVKRERRRPGVHAVAGFASVLLRVQFVRITVTRNTASVLEHILMGLSSPALLVAVCTCRSFMGANQIEPRLAVASKSKGRGNERVCIVTGLAPIGIPRHKLQFVSVLMAIRTRLEFWMVVCYGSCFLVTVNAGNDCMLPRERVFRGHVRLHIES
ncbi:MAG TPA: hypothetical protein VFR18_13260 [Terriglobia bacterium]|nr:hypothetical protein [Terriglobia bacterium]